VFRRASPGSSALALPTLRGNPFLWFQLDKTFHQLSKWLLPTANAAPSTALDLMQQASFDKTILLIEQVNYFDISCIYVVFNCHSYFFNLFYLFYLF
jgi:hypothetical protein